MTAAETVLSLEICNDNSSAVMYVAWLQTHRQDTWQCIDKRVRYRPKSTVLSGAEGGAGWLAASVGLAGDWEGALPTTPGLRPPSNRPPLLPLFPHQLEKFLHNAPITDQGPFVSKINITLGWIPSSQYFNIQ